MRWVIEKPLTAEQKFKLIIIAESRDMRVGFNEQDGRDFIGLTDQEELCSYPTLYHEVMSTTTHDLITFEEAIRRLI